jgi:hypothetical protein
MAVVAPHAADAGIVTIVGPGDRKQTIVIVEIKKPPAAAAYQVIDDERRVVGNLRTNGVNPFNHEAVLSFALTPLADEQLEEPLSHLTMHCVGSSGLVIDDGAGQLFALKPGQRTSLDFNFVGRPDMSASIIFDSACPADFNNDGQVDFFDYLDFAAAFDVGDPSADFNGDAQVDFFDYLDFAGAMDAGC